MSNYKPSQLPIDTVIDDEEHGTFRKDAPGTWVDISGSKNPGWEKFVWDEGPTEQEKLFCDGLAIDEPADEYFKNFKILAWPAVVVEYMLKHYDDLSDPDTFLDEALEDIRNGWGQPTPEEERKRQQEAIKRISAEYKADLEGEA